MWSWLSYLFPKLFIHSEQFQIRSFGLSQVQPFKEALYKQQFATLYTIYDMLSIPERTLLIEGICFDNKNGNYILAWHNKQANALSYLFVGVWWTHLAWVHRTGLRAKHVSEDKFSRFFDCLEKAQENLEKAIDAAPNDVEAYARMLRVMMGLSEKEGLYNYFDKMIKIKEDHLFGHLYMFNALTEKWLGSEKEVTNFVLKVCNNLPKGSLLYALVPALHIELSLEQDEISNYFRQEKVKTQIEQAASLSVDTIDILDKSILQPVIFNYFTIGLYFLGQKQKAKEYRKYFGNYLLIIPWSSFNVTTPRLVDKFLEGKFGY
jgi:tetratricopeptide (TPR) repeat protein